MMWDLHGNVPNEVQRTPSAPAVSEMPIPSLAPNAPISQPRRHHRHRSRSGESAGGLPPESLRHPSGTFAGVPGPSPYAPAVPIPVNGPPQPIPSYLDKSAMDRGRGLIPAREPTPIPSIQPHEHYRPRSHSHGSVAYGSVPMSGNVYSQGVPSPYPNAVPMPEPQIPSFFNESGIQRSRNQQMPPPDQSVRLHRPRTHSVTRQDRRDPSPRPIIARAPAPQITPMAIDESALRRSRDQGPYEAVNRSLFTNLFARDPNRPPHKLQHKNHHERDTHPDDDPRPEHRTDHEHHEHRERHDHGTHQEPHSHREPETHHHSHKTHSHKKHSRSHHQAPAPQVDHHHHSQSQEVVQHRPHTPARRTQQAETHNHSKLPSFIYSKCTGRKKALCVGVNYLGASHELRGCINDAKDVRKFLINYHNYDPVDIVILTDDSPHSRQQPTRRNILDAMRWLVKDAEPHDSLFFHYSGHGGQTRDLDGDEVDGYDEVIYPVDFKKTSHIIDDEMHQIMVMPLPAGCRLTALFDSCHSGTVLDLPYVYTSHCRLRGSIITDRARARKATPADVISWSGCKDDGSAADTFVDGEAVGAMSYAFRKALVANPRQSYRELLKSIRLILAPKYSQKPQLGSSHHIDTDLRFVL